MEAAESPLSLVNVALGNLTGWTGEGAEAKESLLPGATLDNLPDATKKPFLIPWRSKVIDI